MVKTCENAVIINGGSCANGRYSLLVDPYFGARLRKDWRTRALRFSGAETTEGISGATKTGGQPQRGHQAQRQLRARRRL